MLSDLRRILLGCVVIACAAVPLHHAVAYEINDIVSVSVNEDTANLICKSKSVLDGIKKIQAGYLKQLVKDTINDLTGIAVNYALQLIKCKVFNFDRTFSLFGQNITFKGATCTQDLGGATVALLKRQALDKIKNDFTARCIADGARKKAELDVRQIILENGPDGGPAYVTNWIDDIYVDEDQRGVRRFCAVLANTSVCPYMAEEVFSAFPECPRSYFENPPDLIGLGGRVDGGDSFLQRAQCTLSNDFSPSLLDYDFSRYGGFDMLALQQQPQNNPGGFIQMAEAELESQRAISVRAAEAEAIAGGGFRSLYGDAKASCLNRDANGFCLALGPVRQPSGAVRDSNAAAIQSEFDWINNATEMNTLMGDVRRRLASMLLTIDEVPLDYEIEFDASTQDYEDIGSGLKLPEDIIAEPPPPETDPGDPGDPLCTGGNPDCFCVRNDPSFATIRDLVGDATRAATIQHPELVQPPGCVGNECSVVPGSEGLFLIAICETTIGDGLECHPNQGSLDEVVVEVTGFGVSVDVITATGRVRVPGQTVAACQPGVQ